jgi:hypothetical protein
MDQEHEQSEEFISKAVPDNTTDKSTMNNRPAGKTLLTIDVRTGVIIIVSVLALVAVVGFSVWAVMDSQVIELQDKNAELTKSIESMKKVKSATTTSTASKMGGTIAVDSRGIATSKVTMYSLTNIQNASWESASSMSYSVISATLTPVIADMGHFRDNYPNKDWVSVGINVVDNRTSGYIRNIPISDNIRLVDGGAKIAPTSNETTIAALQSKTIYVNFPVDKTSNSFDLWTGDLAKPTINKLNFSNGTSQYGYFSGESGYSTTLQ